MSDGTYFVYCSIEELLTTEELKYYTVVSDNLITTSCKFDIFQINAYIQCNSVVFVKERGKRHDVRTLTCYILIRPCSMPKVYKVMRYAHRRTRRYFNGDISYP